MEARSVYFKGDICFKKDWVGFDTAASTPKCNTCQAAISLLSSRAA